MGRALVQRDALAGVEDEGAVAAPPQVGVAEQNDQSVVINCVSDRPVRAECVNLRPQKNGNSLGGPNWTLGRDKNHYLRATAADLPASVIMNTLGVPQTLESIKESSAVDADWDTVWRISAAGWRTRGVVVGSHDRGSHVRRHRDVVVERGRKRSALRLPLRREKCCQQH